MSDAKIRAIVKRPDEKFGHVTYISNTLKNFQRTVEGPIETISIGKDVVVICNEEGKNLKLQWNFKIQHVYSMDVIRGTVVIVGVDGEDFCDCPLDFPLWKSLLKMWGN